MHKLKNGEDLQGIKKISRTRMPDSLKQMKSTLSAVFGTNVQTTYNSRGRGKISIPFANDDDLNRINEIFAKFIEK